MALDGIVIHAVVHELQACVGGRIHKIHQPSEHDIVLQIRAQSANIKLLLSANPTYPRVHKTEATFINPMEAPMFCMLLRKYCENGMIEAVEQVGTERILHIRIRQRDELGDISVKTVVVELMGRHSNIILIDPASGTIMDGIHHVTPAISSYRIVMPGSAYTAPPEQDKADPLTASLTEIADALRLDPLEDATDQTLATRIVERFSGISPLVAREIAYRGQDDPAGPFYSLMRQIGDNRYEPNIVTNADTGKSVYSVVGLSHLQGECTPYRSVSECLEAYYGDKAERDTVKQRVSDLLRFLQNEKNKNVKKLDKLHDTAIEAKDADKHRITGELLTASLHRVKRGDKMLETVNYYDEEQGTVTILLDPLLSPSENAQRYFKKYTKSKNSQAVVEAQIESTHAEIAYIESLLQQLEHASVQDVEEIRDELVEQGYVRDRNKKMRKKKKQSRPVLSCYTSSEDIPIFVGKNNTQNDYLTNRLAHSGDVWLHTKDIPGSHVVIRNAEFGDATLEEAALLAAYFSQGRASSLVPVDYTLVRHVRKPNGAKPGFVIYDHQKTLFVTPDEERIKKMKVVMK